MSFTVLAKVTFQLFLSEKIERMFKLLSSVLQDRAIASIYS